MVETGGLKHLCLPSELRRTETTDIEQPIVLISVGLALGSMTKAVPSLVLPLTAPTPSPTPSSSLTLNPKP